MNSTGTDGAAGGGYTPNGTSGGDDDKKKKGLKLAAPPKDYTQLLPPWTKPPAQTDPSAQAATPPAMTSSFWLITQNLQARGFTDNLIVHDCTAKSKDACTRQGTHLWKDDGCGPASMAASLRWYVENCTTWQAPQPLKDLVNDKTQPSAGAPRADDPREYMKLFYPDKNGKVAVVDATDACGNDWLFNKIGAPPYGLKQVPVSLATVPKLAALLATAPIIVTWKSPGHFSTVHGVVKDQTTGKYRVWLADPGYILTSSWGITASEAGKPAGMPMNGVYIDVDFDDFQQNKLNLAWQLQA